MTRHIYAPAEDLYQKAAELIAESLVNVLRQKDEAVLGIPGGRSVAGVFNYLKRQPIPWERIHIFMVDERLVPTHHEASNYRLAKEHLIDHLIEETLFFEINAHPFKMEPHSHDFGIGRYAEELDRVGGRYDVLLLSAGEDGHIGALYPNHASISDDSENYVLMHDSPKPPKDRMTMSRKLVMAADSAVLMVVGDKRSALEKFLKEETSPEVCPAVLVKGIRTSFLLSDIER